MGLFTDQQSWTPIVETPTGNGDTLNNLQKITMGAGANRLEANIKDGFWLGADTFANAPASIDFLGNSLFSSVTIKNEDGDILIDSNSSTQDYIQIINSKLNTDSQEILSDFDFGSTDYSGAVKSGDITWNSTTGAITGGSGIVVYRGGIVGAKAGVATFTISSSTGDATFAGTLSAPSGTLGTITSGLITGANIQTNTTGYRIKLNGSNNRLEYLNGDTVRGYMTVSADGDVLINAIDDIKMQVNGTTRFAFGATAFKPQTDNSQTIGEAATRFASAHIYGAIRSYTGNIRCGNTFESSDGSDGINYTKDIVMSVYNGGANYAYREFEWKDGLLVSVGSEKTASS